MRRFLAALCSYWMAFTPLMAKDLNTPITDDDLNFWSKPGGTPMLSTRIKGDTGKFQVDEIQELTPDAGVTIDGTLIKDGNWSGTVTGAVYTTGNQIIDGTKTFNSTISGSIDGNAATVTTNANLTGDITSVGNATSIAGNVIVNADINSSAAIADTKLATISTAGKVSNSATTATSANTASAIVARGASGEFSAGAITGTSFSGNGSSLTSLNATNVSSGTLAEARLPYRMNQNVRTTDGVKFNSGHFGGGALGVENALFIDQQGDDNGFGMRTGNYGGARFRIRGRDQTIGGTAGSFNHTVDFILGTSNHNGGAGYERAVLSIFRDGWSDGDIIEARSGARFSGNGSSLTSLNATNISSGTIANARLPSAISVSTVSATHSGDGAGLTSLNGSNISSGTIASARIGDLPATKITSGTLPGAVSVPPFNLGLNPTFNGNVQTGAGAMVATAGLYINGPSDTTMHLHHSTHGVGSGALWLGNRLLHAAVSDERLKDFKETTRSKLKEVLSYPIRDYSWKKEFQGTGGQGVHMGMGAQTLYKIAPELVHRPKDPNHKDQDGIPGGWAIHDYALVYPMIKAFQEYVAQQKTIIAALEDRIGVLEKK